MTKNNTEFDLIDWIRRHRHLPDGDDVITDIGDDMAVVRLGEERVLITTDMLLENVHFNLGGLARAPVATLEQVGYKAMACSLSDCAAMAAVPLVAVVAVALPHTMSMTDARRINAGLQQAARKYHCPLVGGDTTSWDKPLAINVTMLARTGPTDPVLRSGAQKGDVIMVTGVLGGSGRGKHLEFTPRVPEALALAQMAPIHAMIDLSDGLASDLGHICRESGVSAVLKAGAIPISEAAQTGSDPLSAALGEGEDFELLFCVSPEDAINLMHAWPEKFSLPITQIGSITASSGEHLVSLQQREGLIEPLQIKGWEHKFQA
ncbi:MAG: thiamine-monophosphate kinase [Sedimentisphaerales bacterium]|nr:thiamine-monophosphate kinase [Sedimentisphaerales bacterium]